jgi:hypothetical protein
LHRHRRVRPVALWLLFFLLAGVTPALAQGDSEVTLDVSPQLFSLLYAARAAGAVPASVVDAMNPATARVESALRQLPPNVVAPLREFFQQPEMAATDLSAYISLALVIGPPPKFEIEIPEDHIPPDAWPLRAFLPRLRDFYQQADVAALWQQVRPFYEKAIDEKQSQVSRLLLVTRGYLRLIEASYPSRTYVVYLEWLVPTALTNARNYGEKYYLVIHPEYGDFLVAVRHQYLHFLLDPVVLKYADAIQPLARLQSIAEKAPRLPKAFQRDTVLLTTECLIRAIELRLERLEPGAASARLDAEERDGFIFVRPFYRNLEGFEQSEPSIRYYFPDLLKDYDVAKETERLDSVTFASLETPAVASQPAPQQQVEALLAEAQSLLKTGDYVGARARLERVLSDFDPNEPRALYGLALLASMEEDSGRAKLYFERTLQVAHETRILGWAHVYLGRIYDLEGNRQQALVHYRAALDLNTKLAKMEEAAQQGLQRPFGQE